MSNKIRRVRTLEVKHFNWEETEQIGSVEATADFHKKDVIITALISEENTRVFNLSLTPEAAANRIASRLNSGKLHLASLFFAKSSFSTFDILDDDGIEVVALGGDSPNDLRIALFAATDIGQSITIDTGSGYALVVAYYQDGFICYSESSPKSGLLLEHFDLSEEKYLQDSSIEFDVSETCAVLRIGEKTIELSSNYSLQEVLEIIVDDRYQKIVLSCPKFSSISPGLLEDLGPIKLLAYDPSGFYLVIAGQEGWEGAISDAECLTYSLFFEEDGFDFELKDDQVFRFSEDGYSIELKPNNGDDDDDDDEDSAASF